MTDQINTSLPDGRKLYLRLLRHVYPYRKVFGLAILAMVVFAATEPAIPALLKPTFDGSFVEKDITTVGWMAVLFVLLFVVRGAASYFGALTLAWVSSHLVMDLRMFMFEKLVSLPIEEFDRIPSGNLISKFTFDAQQVTEASTHVLTVLVGDSLKIVGLLAWMFYLDWQLTLIALLSTPVVVFTVMHFGGRLRKVSLALQQTMGDVTHVLDESIGGQRVVRTYGGQDYECSRFRRTVNRTRGLQLKFAAAANANSPIAQFSTAIAFAVILYLSALQSAANEITVGGFVSFFAAMGLLFPPVKRLTGITGRLQKGIAGAQSVFALIDELSELDLGTEEPDNIQGRVSFHHVSFTYQGNDRPAIDDVSFEIEPGETLALVGASGSGKSTLINLIPRFYTVNSGQIRVDGIDVQRFTLTSLRSQLAVVSQDVVLFNDTLRANIAYGPLANASDKDIAAAVRSAHVDEFVDTLTDGLETNLGESGARLSGGQRQRVAIARAFLKNAPILILDEATSSLDSVSEGQIQDSLEHLRQGRTTIVIAHKLATIEKSDRIVVLDNGRIAGIGTHQSLLRDNSLYAALYRFQFAEHADDGSDLDASSGGA